MRKIKNWMMMGIFIISAPSFGQKPSFVTAKINNVLIYLNGAEITHEVSVNLQKGTNEIVVKNVANQLDDNSIRVRTNKPVTILSATFSRQYYKDYEVDYNSLAVKKVKDSIDVMTKRISITQNKIDSDNEAIQMLDMNRQVGGGNTGLNVAELTKAIEFYRQKRSDLSNSVFDLNKEQAKNREILKTLQNQLTVSQSDEEKISDGKIVLQLMSETTQSVQLDLTYLTQLASWSPFYEIASEGLDSKLHLTSKAKVYQTTGIDWKKVHITLSSSQPNPNNQIPELSNWYLSMNLPQPIYGNARTLYEAPTAVSESIVVTKISKKMEQADGDYKMANTSADYTNFREQVLSLNYDIQLPYDIYSNGKAHTITVAEQDIPASYHYYTIPKINSDAYLLAYITDYNQYNLLAGEASVSFEGTYVGKTYLDPTSTKDTLEIAMGIDKGVVVKREKVAEKSGKKIFTNNREANFEYRISIRNNKKTPIQITTKDQYPISQDKEVVVELTDKGNGIIDTEKSFITWNLDIPSQKSKEVKFSYKVTYPKNKEIFNLY